jgi:hypothetical protein
MNRHTGAYYTATVKGPLMIIEDRDGHQTIMATRDEALDLRAAIDATIGAMPVDIGTDMHGRQATRAAMDRADSAAYPGDPYRGR